MRSFTFAVAGLVALAPAEAAAGWYDCTAWGSSHTGRYTFRVETEPCGVYWREIDAHLDIEVCAPPRIVAEKPFAVSTGYVVEFDLDTGGVTPVSEGGTTNDQDDTEDRSDTAGRQGLQPPHPAQGGRRGGRGGIRH